MTGEDASPAFATIVDWTEGRLDGPAADAVAAAARSDPRVRELVAWLAGLRRVAAGLPLVEPPPVVGQRLHHLYARRAAGAVAPVPVVASLLVDSRRDLGLAGVRAADDPDDVVHLAYTSDIADVVLDVRPVARGRVDVDGQVLLSGPDAGATAFAARATGPGGAPVRSVGGDRHGRFRLPALPDTVTSLRLDSGGIAIVVALDLRPPP